MDDKLSTYDLSLKNKEVKSLKNIYKSLIEVHTIHKSDV